MSKKDFLARQREERRAFLDAGLEMGRQQATDMFFIALADFELMGNKKLRPEEIEMVLHKTEELMRYYHPAFEKHDEADYFQDKLDDELRVAIPDGKLVPFKERYKYAKTYDYNKGKWL